VAASTGVIECRSGIGGANWNDVRRAFEHRVNPGQAPPAYGTPGRSQGALEAARAGVTWSDRIAARSVELEALRAQEDANAATRAEANRLRLLAARVDNGSAGQRLLLRQASQLLESLQ